MRMFDNGSEDKSFNCLHCGALSFHAWSTLRVQSQGLAEKLWPLTDEGEVLRVVGTDLGLTTDSKFHSWAASPSPWRAATCSACGRASVWRKGECIFPRSFAPNVGPPHAEMPPNARDFYNEARATLPVSRRASAALVRAALEMLLRDLAVTPGKKKLFDLIGEMQGAISEDLWKILTIIRELGNTVLHDDEGSLTAIYLDDQGGELTEAIFHAMNELVEERIARPKRIGEAYELIPETKRAAAEANSSQN